MGSRFAWLCPLLLSLAAGSNAAAQTQEECNHDPFALQKAVAVGVASTFCHGLLAASQQNVKAAERELSAVIKRNPHAEEAYTAHASLLSIYFREGRYRLADKELEHMLTEKPAQPDTLAIRSLLMALSQTPGMRVASRSASSIRSERTDGNLHIPVTINGRTATYIVDTGANLSLISESEVKGWGWP